MCRLGPVLSSSPWKIPLCVVATPMEGWVEGTPQSILRSVPPAGSGLTKAQARRQIPLNRMGSGGTEAPQEEVTARN